MTESGLAGLSPPQIDELWSEAIEPASRKRERAAGLLATGRRYARHGSFYAERAASYKADGEKLMAEAEAEYKAASAPFDAEYERRGGWTRYLLVVSSSNGHVHRGSGTCSALTPGVTMVAPVYGLSGEDDEGVVVSAGHTACSKCFPDAPVETVEDKRAANAAKGRCSGSGEQATSLTSNRRYGKCPGCGATFGVSTYGKIRPHKPAKEAK